MIKYKAHISLGVAIAFIVVQLATSIHYLWVPHVSREVNHEKQLVTDAIPWGHQCEHLHLKIKELFFLIDCPKVRWQPLLIAYRSTYYLDSPKQEWKFIFYTRGPPLYSKV